MLGAVLCDSLDLAFGQHLSNLAACCVYGAARQANHVLSFKRITTAFAAASPHTPPSVFQQVGNH